MADDMRIQDPLAEWDEFQKVLKEMQLAKLIDV